jgi:Arm DNA-binding domain
MLRASTVLPTAVVIQHPNSKQQYSTKSCKFTKTIVNSLRCPPEKSETFFWDASCAGFGMRALSSGRRTWIFQYRDEHRRTRRIALGDVSAVSLDIARQAARQHAATVTQGGNPSVERKSKRQAATVLDLIEAYLAHAKDHQRARSYKETERHLLPMRLPFTMTAWKLYTGGISQSFWKTSRNDRAPLLPTVCDLPLVPCGAGACDRGALRRTATRWLSRSGNQRGRGNARSQMRSLRRFGKQPKATATTLGLYASAC